MVPPPPHGLTGVFRTDLHARSAYSEGAGPFRIVPSAVAVPRHVADLVILLDHARQHRLSLIPRGAGSGMPGGNVGEGVVVDLRAFDAAPTVHRDERIVSAGAAVTWRNLATEAAAANLRLPPDPSSGAFCTIGGMIATNAAGARSVRFGSIRRWVRGVEFVTADGEVGWLARARAQRPTRTPHAGQQPLHTSPLSAELRWQREARPLVERRAATVRSNFPHTSKNSSGYAIDRYLESGELLDIVIGSEGTLGFITRVELDLHPVPTAESGVLLGLHDLEALGDVVQYLLTLEPSAVELLDRSFLDFTASDLGLPAGSADAVLIVEFERETEAAARGVVGDAVRGTRDWCAYVQTAVRPTDRERMWAIRKAASPRLARLTDGRRSLQFIEDGCVPVAALGQYIRDVRDAARHAGIDIVAFGHAGDGHLHVNALVDPTDPTFPHRLGNLFEAVSESIVRLGGTPSGEHGDGRLRANLVRRAFGPDIVELFAAVKGAFDPAGIFNPGVILPEADQPPVSRLKVGPDAVDIPPLVAEALREMERTAGWGESKLDVVPVHEPRG